MSRHWEDSGCGKLDEQDCLKRLADEVLDRLGKEGKIPGPKLGRVLLAGHSGAYRVISYCLDRGGLENNITDVCLLDASYDRLDSFVAWAARRSTGRLFSIFTNHLAAENVQLMTQLRAKAMKVKGYISGETLRSFDNPHRFLVISNWNSVEDWKIWEKNPDRLKFQEELNTLLLGKEKTAVFTHF